MVKDVRVISQGNGVPLTMRESSPYRRLGSLRYLAVALLLFAIASNFSGQLALGYYLLGAAVTVMIVWSFAQILVRSRE